MDQVQQPRILQRDKPAAVSVGGTGHLSFFLQENLPVVVHSQCHLLLKEVDILRFVSEKFVLCQETHGCVMILVAGHHKQMNPCVRLPHHIQKIVHQALEDIEFPGDAHIVYTFRVIRAKPCSHAARQKDCPHPACADGFQTRGRKAFPVRLDFRQLHGGKGRDNASLKQFLLMSAGIDHIHVGGFDLCQKSRFFCLGQFLKVFQHMGLSVFFQLLFCL